VYSVHALVFLARRKEQTPLPSHEIAEACGVPPKFLLKLLKALVPVGLLGSLKGPQGGYWLAKSPRDITLLEIVEAIDPPVWANFPAFENGRNSASGRLRRIYEGVAEGVRNYLQKIRLSDLARR
jgi:Rrf2 family protein